MGAHLPSLEAFFGSDGDYLNEALLTAQSDKGFSAGDPINTGLNGSHLEGVTPQGPF